jgi:uncharacterized protein involved in exopolysaccharide biosynthesis
MMIGARESALAEQIDTLRQELAANDRESGAEALERQLEADRARLRSYQAQGAPGQASEGVPARLVTPAAIPRTPAYPRVALSYGIGLGAGLLVGLALACALELRRPAPA